MELNWLAIGFFVLGVFARILVPWLLVRYKDPDGPESKWTWRYVWPQLIGLAIVLLVTPVVMDDAEAINEMRPVLAYVAGWGTADFAKTLFLDVPDAARNNKK